MVVRAVRLAIGEGVRDFTIPSCGDCNRATAHRDFKTIGAKRRWVSARLQRQRRALFAKAVWTQSEIDDLGHGLRAYVLSGEVRKEWLRQRMVWKNKRTQPIVSIALIRLNLDVFGSASAVRPARRRSTRI